MLNIFYMSTLNGITAVFGICVIWTLLLGNIAKKKKKWGQCSLKFPYMIKTRSLW